MNQMDFLKLIGGGTSDAELVPVACLLKTGRALAGYFNRTINADLVETVVLVNVLLLDLGRERTGSRAVIEDFNEFLEEIVERSFAAESESEVAPGHSAYGRAIPLAAVPMDELAVVYPVAQIARMLQKMRTERPKESTYGFFDLNRSEILQVLRTKLW